jgi:acetyl esterase/lipase
MKRYFIVIISLIIIVIFFGCQEHNSDITQKETTGQVTETSVQTIETTTKNTESEESDMQTIEDGTSQTETETETTDSGPVRYSSVIFEQVDVETAVFSKGVNSKGDPAWLRLDLYTPAGDSEINRPVIIWIHGGGFTPGNNRTQSYIVTLSEEFAKRGYVCIAPDYRVRDNPEDDWAGTINDAIDDIMLATDWIRENCDAYNIDKSRIIVGGGSAGGETAVNFCFKDSDGSSVWDRSGILGLIDLWGSPAEEFILSAVDSSDPPTLIIHGTEDEVVPYENSVWLKSELDKNNVECELVPLDGSGHTPTDRMDEIIAKTSEFVYDLIS